MSKKRLYIAGPMEGYPLLNFPAFFDTEKRLEPDWKIENPARMSIEFWYANGLIPSLIDWKFCKEFIHPTTPLEVHMRRDIHHITLCTAIAFLPGWRESKGAQKELQIAKWCGLMLFEFDFHHIDDIVIKSLTPLEV